MGFYKELKKPVTVFTICLLAPAFGGIIRKALPGQPVMIDALPALLLFAVGTHALFSKRKINGKIIGPLAGWALFQCVFAFLSIQEEILVGISAFITRICPMFMAIIAYKYIRNESDLQNAVIVSAVLIMIMLPFGVYASIFGNSGLPRIFAPLDIITSINRDERVGISSFAGVFSSQWLLSISCLGILYLFLTQFFIGKKSIKQFVWLGIVSASSLAIIYFSTRRGAFLAGLVGIGFVLFKTCFPLKQKTSKKVRFYIFAGTVATVAIMFFLAKSIDKYTPKEDTNRKQYSRSEWVFSEKEISVSDRLKRFFIPITLQWIEFTPMGNYLGYGGPEIRAFKILGYREFLGYVEVGSAQLVAEMGIAGVLIMPILIIITIIRISRLAKRSRYKNAIYVQMLFMAIVFTLYYTKESLMLVNVSVGNFYFWAIPGICAAMLKMEKDSLKVKAAATRQLI